MRRGATCWIVAVVAVLAAPPAAAPQPPEITTPPPRAEIAAPRCPLLADDPGVPVRRLDVDDVRAIGKAYSDSNAACLARLDSLLRAGDLGAPGSPAARAAAHVLARLLTLNAYSYMIHFATDRDTVWEADETTLGPAFETFSDPGVVPIARLVRARMGLGWMAARYDLSQRVQTETMLGGRRLRVRVDDMRIAGRTRRVLVMDLPTGLHDLVEVWIDADVTMRVEHLVAPGPSAPYEAFVLDEMEGLWVHKFGVHQPRAFVFWVTPRDRSRTRLPERPLVGVRIYVPHLRLRLPGFLPDVGFEDLREVDLPQPILELEILRRGKFPAWLEPAQLRGFKRWEGIGPVPPALRARFPDR